MGVLCAVNKDQRLTATKAALAGIQLCRRKKPSKVCRSTWVWDEWFGGLRERTRSAPTVSLRNVRLAWCLSFGLSRTGSQGCFKLLSWRPDVAFPIQENQPGSKPDDDEKNQYQNIPRMATLQFLRETDKAARNDAQALGVCGVLGGSRHERPQHDQVAPRLSSKDMN